MLIMTKKRKVICILTLIPVLAVMAVIFYFSSQTAEASTVTSGGFVDAVMSYVGRFMGDASTQTYAHIENTVTFIVRKAAHFLEFAALGFFMSIHVNTFKEKKAWLISAVVCVIYAVSDELHQHFVSERAPRVLDVCVDSTGAICAIAFVSVIIYIYRRRKQGENIKKAEEFFNG